MNNSIERAKLLYSVKEHLSLKDAERQDKSVTINDILKSVQILEDADTTVNNKSNKTNFGSISNQFIKLSTLSSFKKIPINVPKTSFSDMPSCSKKDPQNGLGSESRIDRASFNNFPLIEKNDEREIYTNCEIQEIHSKKCKQIFNSDENTDDNHLSRHIGDMQEEKDLNSVNEGTLQNCSNELYQQIFAINHENQTDIFEKDNKQLHQKNVWDTTSTENSEQLLLGTLTTSDKKACNNDILHRKILSQISASSSEENNIMKDKHVEGHAKSSSSPLKVENELNGFTYTQLFNDDLTYFMNNVEEQNSSKPNDLDKCSGPLEVLSRNKQKYINLIQPAPNSDVFGDTSEKQKLSVIQRSEPMDDITSEISLVDNKEKNKLTYDAFDLNPKRDVFSTASGKTVHVDSKSLDKVRLLFIDDAENSNAFVANKKEKLQKKCPKDAEIQLEESKNMYMIASGNPVEEIKNESSNKIRQNLLKDYVNDTGDGLVSDKDNSPKNTLKQHDAQLSKIIPFSFTTAGGKSVKIDSKNLDNVRLLFNEDLERAMHITVDQTKSSIFGQLQKGIEPFRDKGKSVEVNSESLDKARPNQNPEILDDVKKTCTLIKNVNEQKQLDNAQLSKITPFSFTTAGGKSVKIDSKNLDKVRLLFNEELERAMHVTVDQTKSSIFGQLQTETERFRDKGKSIEVNSESLDEARPNHNPEILDDVKKTCTLIKNVNEQKQLDNVQLSKITPFSFTTAGGKSVEIDSKNLDKVRLLFNEDLESAMHITVDQTKSSIFGQLQKETEPFRGKGKSVEENSESLDDARLLLNQNPEIMDDAKKNCTLIKNVSDQKQLDISKSTPFAFSTAGGKSVKIDSKSLDKARLLFDDDGEDNLILKACQNNTNLLKLDKQQQRKETKLFNFSTAKSGKSVNIESKSLEDVKLLCNDDAQNIEAVTSMIDHTWLADNLEKGSERELKIEVFSKSIPLFLPTAGGRLVELESKSVDKARMLFSDNIDNIACLEDPLLLKNVKIERAQRQDIEQGGLVKADNESFKEFSKVSDSIKTLSKGCKEDKLVSTFKSGDVSTINMKKKNSHLSEGTPFMFSTASGKAINVDSKSLEKVRLLFKDEEGNSLESENINDKSLIINETEPFVFSSASGKTITAGRQILDEVKFLNRDDAEKIFDISSYHNLPTAFSFASGKSVKVDPGSLSKVSSLSEVEPIDETDFSLKTGDTSTRNNLETNKPVLFKKEQPPKPANTILQSCFRITHEDIDDLAAADLEKFNTLQNVKINSKELLANRASDNEDQLSTVSRLSVNRALFKEMPAQELVVVNSESRCDDNPVSLNRDDDTHVPVLNILEKNYSAAKNGDIFGNNSINCIMLLLNEETNTRDSKERNQDHLKFMSDNNKSDCYLKDPEYSNIMGVNDRNNDSLVADVQVNFEYPEKEAIVPNRFQNEGTASNIHKEKSKAPDEKINLEEVRNRKSIVSDTYSDSENTQMSGMSLFHEVSESAAALLVDEQHNGTWRTRGIVTSPSMCAERMRPNVSIVSLNDSQNPGFTTITSQMCNLAYTPSRVKISEKRKIYGEDKYYEYKKPKVELFSKQQIEEVCYKSHQLQKEIINQKFKTVIKPEAGLLFIKKQERDRLSLKNMVGGLRPKIYTEEQLLTFGLKKEVIRTSAHNSSLFQFDGKHYSEEDIDFFSKGLRVGKESYLLFRSDSKAGLTEIQQCFLASPGVDPKLLPDEWVANHYRWIVWKLASMEKSFPEIFGGRCLNPENILQQLKYRYDREIDRAQRSAFKKISEGDESASRLFICCVAAVRNNDSEIDESTYDLELTDGWYSLWTSVDQEMISLINKGKVCVGSKLAIMGAESINPDQICDPLKVVKECRLKVSTNSCRRARWDAKLGFVNSRCLSSIQLGYVLPHGGVVGKTSALVARVYPLLHMTKDSEGKTVFRNERTQSVEEARYEKIYNEKAEELYEQVWREVEQKYKKTIDVGMYSSKDLKTLSQPDVLWNIIEQTCDPATEGLLSNEQLKLVADYREHILSKMRQEVQDVVKVKMRDILPERHIIKLLKVRLVDCEKEIEALLTIWRPTEEICSILKEKKIISFTHLYASGTRERVLQLTNTRQTRYQEVSSFASNKFLRRVTCLSELKPHGVTRPVGFLSSEIDVVGIVIYIKHPDHPKGLTIVYLTNLEGEYIAISFWTSLKLFGYEDILTENSLVCCYNLQWRTGSGAWRIPNVFATELSLFTQLPKLSHLEHEFSKIKSLLLFKKTTDLIAEHKLQLLTMLKKREYSSVGSSPSGGLMEYVSTSENQEDITPVQKKIRKLSNYGRPPPLAPLPLFSKSPEVLSDFRSPCRVRGSHKLGSSPLSLLESDKS